MTLVTLTGKGKLFVVLIKVTSAPNKLADFAKLYPIFPEESLVIKRTGSIRSLVPPAVMMTFLVDNGKSICCSNNPASINAKISSGSGRRPFPT